MPVIKGRGQTQRLVEALRRSRGTAFKNNAVPHRFHSRRIRSELCFRIRNNESSA
jgi:hypothetical protein